MAGPLHLGCNVGPVVRPSGEGMQYPLVRQVPGGAERDRMFCRARVHASRLLLLFLARKAGRGSRMHPSPTVLLKMEGPSSWSEFCAFEKDRSIAHRAGRPSSRPPRKHRCRGLRTGHTLSGPRDQVWDDWSQGEKDTQSREDGGLSSTRSQSGLLVCRVSVWAPPEPAAEPVTRVRLDWFTGRWSLETRG